MAETMPELSPEAMAEQFIQAAVDSAPEPLRRLGEYLATLLEEDKWATVEPMLLGAASTHTRALEALREAREALERLVYEFGSAIDTYDRIGPDWTHKDGTQVIEVSTLLDRREFIEQGRDALSRIDAILKEDTAHD